MTPTRIAILVVAAVLVGVGVVRRRDPHRTALPFGTTDLSTVRSQLDALPDSDRVLVEGYVRRSGGDVLPARFADPDAPLTARTFAQAIELQRRFVAGQAAVDAQVGARRAAREAALTSLRAVLEVELVGREIVPREQLSRLPGSDDFAHPTAKVAIDDVPILVTTYRLRNVASRTVTSLRGQVDVQAADGRAAGVARPGCFLDHQESLAPGQSIELRCADSSARASAADSAFVDLPARAVVLEWTPKAIVFADGTTLEYDGP